MEDIKATRHEEIMAQIKTDYRHEEIMAQIRTDPVSVANMLVAWETEISKVMPLDYKSWWQNSKLEWPVIARMSIESLREREKLAWEMVTEVQVQLDQEKGI